MSYAFDFPLIGNDYVFPAGHRIGLVVVSSYKDYGAFGTVTIGTPTVTIDTHLSKVVLPVVGGSTAVRSAGVYLDTTAPTLDLPSPPDGGGDRADDPGVVRRARERRPGRRARPCRCAPASGSAFPVGTTTVMCTATDASGNAKSGSFAVHRRRHDGAGADAAVPPRMEATGPLGCGAVSFTASATDAADPAPG